MVAFLLMQSPQLVPDTASLQVESALEGRGSRGGDRLHQMVHKALQRNIVCEYSLSSLCTSTVGVSRMRCRRVKLRKEESGLRPIGITYDESRERETILDQFLQSVSISAGKHNGLGLLPAHLPLAALKYS